MKKDIFYQALFSLLSLIPQAVEASHPGSQGDSAENPTEPSNEWVKFLGAVISLGFALALVHTFNKPNDKNKQQYRGLTQQQLCQLEFKGHGHGCQKIDRRATEADINWLNTRALNTIGAIQDAPGVRTRAQRAVDQDKIAEIIGNLAMNLNNTLIRYRNDNGRNYVPHDNQGVNFPNI